MSVLFVLILISGLIATAFLVAFIWSVRSGQYDDTFSPSVRILFNNEVKKDKKKRQADPDSSKVNSVDSSSQISPLENKK